MNKLFCGIDLPLSTIFQSVPGSLLHPGIQIDAEMTNKQTYKQISENTGGDCWKNIISFFVFFCDKENKFKRKVSILSAQYDQSSWLGKI